MFLCSPHHSGVSIWPGHPSWSTQLVETTKLLPRADNCYQYTGAPNEKILAFSRAPLLHFTWEIRNIIVQDDRGQCCPNMLPSVSMPWAYPNCMSFGVCRRLSSIVVLFTASHRSSLWLWDASHEVSKWLYASYLNEVAILTNLGWHNPPVVVWGGRYMPSPFQGVVKKYLMARLCRPRVSIGLTLKLMLA